MKDNKINIAFVIDTIATSSAGTEKQLLYLLNNLDSDRFEPHLVCFYESDWMKNNSLSWPIHALGIKRLYSRDFFRGVKKFRDLHEKYHFDIVQTFFREGNLFGTYAAYKAGVHPIVSSRRNVGYWHNRYQIGMLRYLRKKTDYYLCNSKAAGEVTIEIEKVDPEKIWVIHNGLELEKYQTLERNSGIVLREEWGVKENELLIGVVANLRPIKNLGIFIKAAAGLSDKFNNLKFVVIGEGDERNNLEELIKENSLSDNFLLPGSRENILPALAAFDIAVLPSANESLSNSLIEYSAAGLPVVCGNVGGNPEIIIDNETGLLYDPTNHQELIEKLTLLVNDKLLREKFSSNGRIRVSEMFTIERMVNEHQKFYSRIIDR